MSGMDAATSGAVFVQTNEPRNRVLAYRRDAEGRLELVQEIETGGAGDGVPHLTSQGSVVITEDGRYLLVTNSASDDVSAFAIGDEGLDLLSTTPTGPTPKSVAERGGLVYALSTGKPAVIGFRLRPSGLEAIAGAEHMLSAVTVDPAQLGFTPDGSTIVVTERGTDSIVTFTVGRDGLLGEMRTHPSSGPTPYGFAFTSTGTLIVTEAFRAEKGAAAASSYVVDGSSVSPVTRSLGNGRSEICWAVVTPDDRYAFTSNFADGAVSRYAIGVDGTLALEDAVAGSSVEGSAGLRDLDLSADGRFLYAIDADARRVFGWRVSEGGSLSEIGSWDGLPATVAGLAAR